MFSRQQTLQYLRCLYDELKQSPSAVISRVMEPLPHARGMGRAMHAGLTEAMLSPRSVTGQVIDHWLGTRQLRRTSTVYRELFRAFCEQHRRAVTALFEIPFPLGTLVACEQTGHLGCDRVSDGARCVSGPIQMGPGNDYDLPLRTLPFVGQFRPGSISKLVVVRRGISLNAVADNWRITQVMIGAQRKEGCSVLPGGYLSSMEPEYRDDGVVAHLNHLVLVMAAWNPPGDQPDGSLGDVDCACCALDRNLDDDRLRNISITHARAVDYLRMKTQGEEMLYESCQ